MILYQSTKKGTNKKTEGVKMTVYTNGKGKFLVAQTDNAIKEDIQDDIVYESDYYIFAYDS